MPAWCCVNPNTWRAGRSSRDVISTWFLLNRIDAIHFVLVEEIDSICGKSGRVRLAHCCSQRVVRRRIRQVAPSPERHNLLGIEGLKYRELLVDIVDADVEVARDSGESPVYVGVVEHVDAIRPYVQTRPNRSQFHDS